MLEEVFYRPEGSGVFSLVKISTSSKDTCMQRVYIVNHIISSCTWAFYYSQPGNDKQNNLEDSHAFISSPGLFKISFVFCC